MRILPIILCASFLLYPLTVTASPPAAERRVALVIGNEAYSSLRSLMNPVNDAKAVASKLRAANFDVVEAHNANLRDMRNTIREFRNKAQKADVKLIFYAGHGIQSNGVNYIIPVDAQIEETDDIRRFSYDLQRLIDQMTASGGLNLILLDSCRDNPFQADSSYRSARQIRVRGFAPMVGGGSDLMILFATAADQVAADGSGSNSPFTESIIKHIDEPGLEFSGMVNRVVKDVAAKTQDKQRPWLQGTPSRSFYFHPRLADPITEEKDWADAQNKGTVEAFRDYRDAYPEGRFARLATDKIERIMDDRRWEVARKADTFEEYDAYLAVETNKLYRGEARRAIKRLDDANWQKAKRVNTPADIRAYLSDERHKANRAEALAALRKLDDLAWHAAGQANTVRSYRTYIQVWDDSNDDLDGEYIAIAQDRIEKLQLAAAWTLASSEDTATAYGRYLDQYPDGPQAGEARKILGKMEDQLWTRAKQENIPLRYRQYVDQKYFTKHREEAKTWLRDTEAEELWQSAELGQLDRSASSVPAGKKEVLERLTKDYSDTPAGGRAEKLLASLSKANSSVTSQQGSSYYGAGTGEVASAGADCDRLAGNPDDPMRQGHGTPYRYLDPGLAVSACLSATRSNPTVARYKYQLARAYQKSDHPGRAVPLLTELTNNGLYSAAYDNLGWIYYMGRAVPRDRRRAKELFRLGAAAGNAEAMHSLGVVHEEDRNYQAAAHWYRQALAKGYSRASRSLAGLPRSRRGSDKSTGHRENPSRPPTQAELEQQRMGLEMMKGVFGVIINRANRNNR